MSEIGTGYIEQAAIIALHNELADELNVEKTRLMEQKEGKTVEEMAEDLGLNYLQGKVIGFELGVNALHAFVVARSADAAGLLHPHLFEED